MSMQNFPRIPKITLRTPADQAKDAKNALQEKYPFISLYLPSGGTQVHEPSVPHQIRPPWGSGPRITATESGGGCRCHDRIRLLVKVFLSTCSNHSPSQHDKSVDLPGHLLGAT